MEPIMKIVRKSLFLCIAGIALALSAPSSRAATVTFDGLPELLVDGAPWFEDGVTVTGDGRDLGAFAIPDAAHLDDSGTGYTSRLDFTMALPFVPIEFRVFGMGTRYLTDFECLDIGCPYAPYDNLLVRTFRGGIVTFEDRLYAGDGGDIWTYTFPELEPVDLLRIVNVLPDVDEMDGDGPFCVNYPCGHFSIDNVKLAPIPLPATAPMLLLAGGLMLLARRKRR
jgi:hypothetical protein